MNKLNRSVARALDIINMMAAQKEAMTITEISKTLDMPKSTAFDIVYTLVDRGYLEIADTKNKAFKLGLKLFQAGASYLENVNFYDIAHPMLEEIAAKAQETAFLAVDNDGQLVYLDKVESTSSVRTSCRIGSTNFLYNTGLGKALLAAYDDEKVKKIVRASGMKPKTPYTITSYEELIVELNKARARGYAIDDRESEVEVFCVAAPIYNSQGQPFAAISIASLVSKMENNPERVQKFGELVAETALIISKRNGFRGENLFAGFQ